MEAFDKHRDISKRPFSPTRRIAFSFFAVIIIGSLLLQLPISNKLEIAPYIDHLFIATSATCVTGLVPLTVCDQYTVFGQCIILCLIQIGGLGFLTLLNLMVVAFKKKLSYTNKIIMQEALNQSSMRGITHYIKRTIKYTMTLELFGALLLSFRFIPDYGLIKGIYYSVFHSISAFCNAGFDLLGSTSLIAYQSDLLVNMVICFLIIAGGLGFIVWIDLRMSYQRYKEKFCVFQLKRFIRTLSLHTKIVLYSTAFLLASGTIVILLLEMNNPLTLGSLNWFDKLLASFFQSTTLRTAGFATIDMAGLLDQTKFFMCIYMFIGGSPAGTAGGIKTVTFVICVLYVLSLVKGSDRVSVMKRTISEQVVKRSMTITFVSISIVMMALFSLTIVEDQSFVDLLFEIFSAFGTVGLTAGVTPLLSYAGKVIIILLMYIGRIGPITMVLIFAKRYNQMKGKDIIYPSGDVLIG